MYNKCEGKDFMESRDVINRSLTNKKESANGGISHRACYYSRAA
jgi:hypothetical protein